jgi:chromosome segregation ATPase
VQFKEENESYRKKLAEAERDVTALRSQVSSSSSRIDKQGGQDIATLRFEKEALETKLRKYLAYCKALESDKNHIIDSLRARKRAVVDDDFAGAVVSLCDQLTSLEEECDALSNAEGRASSYLVDMERLRERVAALQNETDESRNKLVKLTRSEAELSSRLNRAEEKNGSLREERDKLRKKSGTNNREAEPEKSRQVKYLEQENLQLMLELKTSKKQLQSTRSELDSMRMKALDDDTEDFTSFMAPQGRASDLSSGIKSKTSRDFQSTPATEDKENNTRETENSGKGSAPGSEKKRRFSRAKPKNTRMRESNSRSVGLGEAGADENNTEECRQS